MRRDILANHTNYKPDVSKEVANVKNDNCHLDNLEYFTHHYLNCYMDHVCVNVVGLSWVLLNYSINSGLRVLLVKLHEPFYFKDLCRFE